MISGQGFLALILAIPPAYAWPDELQNTKPRRVHQTRHGLVRIAGLALRMHGRKIIIKVQTRW